MSGRSRLARRPSSSGIERASFRQDQDEFALRSHRLAIAAWGTGFFADHVVPVPGVQLVRDESIRPDTSLKQLSSLRQAFRADGTVTAGNSSPLSDGASGVVLGSEAGAAVFGEPIARIAGRGVAGSAPQFLRLRTGRGGKHGAEACGISWGDVGSVELNEAFAAQSLACVRAWDVDPALVNQHGGAIAIGPLDASGARILGTLAHTLRRSGQHWLMAAICIGVGQGLAVVLENAAR